MLPLPHHRDERRYRYTKLARGIVAIPGYPGRYLGGVA